MAIKHPRVTESSGLELVDDYRCKTCTASASDRADYCSIGICIRDAQLADIDDERGGNPK